MLCLNFNRYIVKAQLHSELYGNLLIGTGFEFPHNIILNGKNHENQDLFNHHFALIKLHLCN